MLPEASFLPRSAGHYKVIVRLTWYAYVNAATGWVKTAGTNYDFTSKNDYSSLLYATSGPGYCSIS